MMIRQIRNNKVELVLNEDEFTGKRPRETWIPYPTDKEPIFKLISQEDYNKLVEKIAKWDAEKLKKLNATNQQLTELNQPKIKHHKYPQKENYLSGILKCAVHNLNLRSHGKRYSCPLALDRYSGKLCDCKTSITILPLQKIIHKYITDKKWDKLIFTKTDDLSNALLGIQKQSDFNSEGKLKETYTPGGLLGQLNSLASEMKPLVAQYLDKKQQWNCMLNAKGEDYLLLQYNMALKLANGSYLSSLKKVDESISFIMNDLNQLHSTSIQKKLIQLEHQQEELQNKLKNSISEKYIDLKNRIVALSRKIQKLRDNPYDYTLLHDIFNEYGVEIYVNRDDSDNFIVFKSPHLNDVVFSHKFYRTFCWQK